LIKLAELLPSQLR